MNTKHAVLFSHDSMMPYSVLAWIEGKERRNRMNIHDALTGMNIAALIWNVIFMMCLVADRKGKK